MNQVNTNGVLRTRARLRFGCFIVKNHKEFCAKVQIYIFSVFVLKTQTHLMNVSENFYNTNYMYTHIKTYTYIHVYISATNINKKKAWKCMKQKLCKQLIRNNALKYFLLTLVISFYLLREFEAPNCTYRIIEFQMNLHKWQPISQDV